MDFEIMGVCFEVVDGLLPIRCQNFTRGSSQSLIDLESKLVFSRAHLGQSLLLTFDHSPEYSSV